MPQQQPEQPQIGAQTRAQALDVALKRPGRKNLQDIARELEAVEEEPMAKTSAPKLVEGARPSPTPPSLLLPRLKDRCQCESEG